MRSIQEKLLDHLRGDSNWSEQDLQEAMQDDNVQQVVQKMVRQHTIEFVDPNNNVPILESEMRLIGNEGENAIQQSPDLIEDQEEKIVSADLRVDELAFNEVKTEINDFIKRNTKK